MQIERFFVFAIFSQINYLQSYRMLNVFSLVVYFPLLTLSFVCFSGQQVNSMEPVQQPQHAYIRSMSAPVPKPPPELLGAGEAHIVGDPASTSTTSGPGGSEAVTATTSLTGGDPTASHAGHHPTLQHQTSMPVTSAEVANRRRVYRTTSRTELIKK